MTEATLDRDSAPENGTRYPGPPARPGRRLPRPLLVVIGSLALVLGALGVILPLLPTTPFVLLAAACYARSSDRLHAWLLRSRLFGPTIHDWREHRSVPRRAKITAVVMIVVCFGLSIAFAVEGTIARIALGAFGVALVGFLLSLRTTSGETAAGRTIPGRTPSRSGTRSE